MITDSDIKKMKVVFVTKKDLENMKKVFATKDDLKENNGILIKEVVELFNATNERIEEVNENLCQRIDKVLEQMKDHNDILDTHERRIEKVEEKVFI